MGVVAARRQGGITAVTAGWRAVRRAQSPQMLWMTWREGAQGGHLLVCHLVMVVLVVADADAVLELHPGEHVGDELVAVEAPPALARGIEPLVGHRQRGLLRARALRHARAQLEGREARLDRVGRSEVPPVLRGAVVERRQRGPVLVELRDGRGYLASNSSRKRSTRAGVRARRAAAIMRRAPSRARSSCVTAISLPSPTGSVRASCTACLPSRPRGRS